MFVCLFVVENSYGRVVVFLSFFFLVDLEHFSLDLHDLSTIQYKSEIYIPVVSHFTRSSYIHI